MIPQDDRSPFAQQRCVDLTNAGSYEIPAFGFCTIVTPGSSRPESSGYTPSGGRTILHVSRPTASSKCSSCCITIVNGPCPIPAGESRRVGTMDSPMLALAGAATYVTGDEVGVKADSFALWTGYKGYMIVGDYDASTGTMRVVKCSIDDLVGGCLYDDHPGRGIPFKIYLGTWNTSQDKWIYDTSVKVDAIDWRYGVPYPDAGATGLFKCRKSDTYGVIWEVVALDCTSPGTCNAGTSMSSTPSNTPSSTPSATGA
jgi:hypothetical protein